MTEAGDAKRFFKTYIKFLKGEIKEYKLGNIGINDTFNNWFVSYCWNQEDPFLLDFAERKNPYEHYEEITEDLYDIEAVI